LSLLSWSQLLCRCSNRYIEYESDFSLVLCGHFFQLAYFLLVTGWELLLPYWYLCNFLPFLGLGPLSFLKRKYSNKNINFCLEIEGISTLKFDASKSWFKWKNLKIWWDQFALFIHLNNLFVKGNIKKGNIVYLIQ
jgi:hypothetical protein